MKHTAKKTRAAEDATPKAVTGMLFVRDTRFPPHPNGRRLVMVVGVMEVPEGADLPGEHQFVVTGSDIPDALALTLLKQPRFDRTEMAQGHSIGSLLTEPIWRT